MLLDPLDIDFELELELELVRSATLEVTEFEKILELGALTLIFPGGRLLLVVCAGLVFGGVVGELCVEETVNVTVSTEPFVRVVKYVPMSSAPLKLMQPEVVQ